MCEEGTLEGEASWRSKEGAWKVTREHCPTEKFARSLCDLVKGLPAWPRKWCWLNLGLTSEFPFSRPPLPVFLPT